MSGQGCVMTIVVLIVWALIFWGIYSVPWGAVDTWLDAQMLVSRGNVIFVCMAFFALALIKNRR